MRHDFDTHRKYNTPPLSQEEVPHWDRVSDQHAAKARELQEAIDSKPVDPTRHYGDFACTWCGATSLRHLQAVRAHLENE